MQLGKKRRPCLHFSSELDDNADVAGFWHAFPTERARPTDVVKSRRFCGFRNAFVCAISQAVPLSFFLFAEKAAHPHSLSHAPPPPSTRHHEVYAHHSRHVRARLRRRGCRFHQVLRNDPHRCGHRGPGLRRLPGTSVPQSQIQPDASKSVAPFAPVASIPLTRPDRTLLVPPSPHHRPSTPAARATSPSPTPVSPSAKPWTSSFASPRLRSPSGLGGSSWTSSRRTSSAGKPRSSRSSSKRAPM